MPLPSIGITVEEITEEDTQPMPSEFNNTLPTEYSVRQPQDIGEYSESQGGSDIQGPSSSSKCLQGQKDNSEAARCVFLARALSLFLSNLECHIVQQNGPYENNVIYYR